MKHLNIRLVVCLFTSMVIASVGVHYLHAYQLDAHAESLIHRAEESHEKGGSSVKEEAWEDAKEHYGAAATNYFRYLRYRRHDLEGRLMYATLLADIAESSRDGQRIVRTAKKLGDTMNEITVANGQLPPRNRSDDRNERIRDLRYRLASLTFLVEKGGERGPLDTIDHLETLLREYPTHADAKTLLYRCYVMRGDQLRGVELLKQVIGLNESGQFDDALAEAPDNKEAYGLLADFYRKKQKDISMADRIMDRAIDVNPDSYTAYLARSGYRFRNRTAEDEEAQLALAWKDVSRAKTLAPDDVSVGLHAYGVASEQKNFAEARLQLADIVDQHPKNPKIYRKLAELEQNEVRHIIESDKDMSKEDQEKQREEANKKSTAWIEKGLTLLHDSMILLGFQANFQLQNGDWEEFENTLKRLDDVKAPKVLIERLEAMRAFREGKWFDASVRLETMRPRFGKNPAEVKRIDSQLAWCYERLGEPDRQLRYYRLVLDQEPSSILAHRGVARALAALGKIDASAKIYRRIRKFIGDKEFAKAPGLWKPLLSMETSLAKKKSDKKEETWHPALELIKLVGDQGTVDAIEFALLRIEHLRARDLSKLAQEQLDDLVKEFPTDLRVRKAQILAAATAKGLDEATQLLDATVEQLGDSVDMRLLRAGFVFRRHSKDVRQRLRQLEKNTEKFSEDEKLELARGIAQYFLRLGDYEEGRRLLEPIVLKRPENMAFRMRLFDIARQAGDEPWMKDLLSDLEKVAGRNTNWKFAEATRLIWRVLEQDDERALLTTARDLLAEVAEDRPEWHRIYQLYARIAEFENRVDDAIRNYGRTLDLGPVDARIVKRLATVHYERREYDQAEEVLRLLGETNDPRMLKAWVDLMMRLGKNAEALAMARKAVSADSLKSDDHRWLGKVLLKAKRYEEAATSLQRAVKLNATDYRGWLALIQAQQLAGKTDLARESVQSARVNLPENIPPGILASAYELVGSVRLAEQLHREYLRMNPKSLAAMRELAQFLVKLRRYDEVKRILFDMLTKESSGAAGEAAQRAWARRQMAGLVATMDGNYTKLNWALDLLELNAHGDKMDDRDHLLRARLLARRPEFESRQQAIKIFERLDGLKPRPTKTSDRLTLARLYERAGKWAKCRDTMVELRGENPNRLDLIAEFIRMQLRNGDANDVQDQHLERLRAVPRQQFLATSLRVETLVKRGKEKEAIALLKGVIAQLGGDIAKSPEKQDILKNIAAFLARLEQYEEAEKIYRLYVSYVPKDGLQLAAFLGEFGDIEESFDILRTSLKNGEDILRVVQVALASAQARRETVSDQLLAQLGKWLKQAERDYPDLKMNQRSLAVYHDLRDEFDEVERIYRAYLNRPGVKGSGSHDEAIVLNNLAFILADKLGKHEGGLKMVEQAIEILGPQTDLVDTRAMVKLAGGDAQGAVKDLQIALDDHRPGKQQMILFHMAVARDKAGQDDEAIKSLELAFRDGLKADRLSKADRAIYDRLKTKLGFDEEEFTETP